MFLTGVRGSILTDQSEETVELSLVTVTPFTSRDRRGQKYLKIYKFLLTEFLTVPHYI